MGNLIVAPPREIGRDPIHTLARWRREAPQLPDVEAVRKRIDMVSLAKLWAGKFGDKESELQRQALAARLTLERRLGELLAGTVSPGKRPKDIVVGDDNRSLPEGITRDASSAAQTLAVTPQKWFDEVVEEVVAGVRRLNLKEIYLEAKRVIAGEAADRPPHEAEGVVLGDFREVGQEIPGESVALIFTDPPYDRASLELYGETAKLAKRVLLPGGSLLAYAPNYALPDVFASCREHLTYWWTLAVLHSGSHALMREYGVRAGYKPLVWFTKGGRFNKQQIIEDTVAGDMEKTEHEWQQGVLEAETIIKALTSPDDLVLDPMCGSGTTLLAARRCGRRYLGIEAKAETASLARERMARKKE